MLKPFKTIRHKVKQSNNMCPLLETQHLAINGTQDHSWAPKFSQCSLFQFLLEKTHPVGGIISPLAPQMEGQRNCTMEYYVACHVCTMEVSGAL